MSTENLLKVIVLNCKNLAYMYILKPKLAVFQICMIQLKNQSKRDSKQTFRKYDRQKQYMKL